ncbi:MAG: FGGY family carbohydrate kinase [Balneolales bacterium]
MAMAAGVPVTVIFDIGKTNKKFLLFDEAFNIVHKEQIILEQAADDDGYPCEDLNLLKNWIYRQFRSVLLNDRFQVKSLNFSTYGASLVHLDDNGEVVSPFYNYLKPYPEELAEEYYARYGGQRKLCLETASPPLGMLNSGMQLFWLKRHKPGIFNKIRRSLHFPQYLSYLFTREFTSELTSIGCHTMLWDFKENNYHRWLEQEDVLGLLPETQPNGAAKQVVFEDSRFYAGPGIHDSSAALAPYLFAFDDPFLLVSTGTWSITFNPFNKAPLLFEELQKDCLCYMNIHGEQVKASRLFLGNEYAHQMKKLNEHFNRNEEHHDLDPDPAILKGLIEENHPGKKLELETAYNSGPCPQDNPGKWQIDDFSSFEEACHQLMLDLVTIQSESIALAQGSDHIERLIITGGFSQNRLFVQLLAARFPDKKVFTASLPHASALGAALVMNGNQKKAGLSLKELLNCRQHAPLKDTGVERYSWNKSAIS